MKYQKMKTTVPFTIASKTIKYPRINLTKVSNMYTENSKILRKEIEEASKNEKIFYAHGLEESVLLKCPH